MIEHIVRLDADVISIEASRSGMEVLDAFAASFDYPNEIGPGVYDIHSPRVPSRRRARAAARARRAARSGASGCGSTRTAGSRRAAGTRSRPALRQPRRGRAPARARPVRGMSALSTGCRRWATTGVGSLPVRATSQDAVAHVGGGVRRAVLPAAPAARRRHDHRVARRRPRPLRLVAGRDRERPRAWDAFLAELERTPPAHRVVKLQVTGPGRRSRARSSARRRPARREALTLARELAVWLAANAAGQVRALAERGLDALLVVDEALPPAVSSLIGAAILLAGTNV